jgi:cell division protein FtsQ
LLDQIVARENLAISVLQENKQGEWGLQILHGPRVLLGATKLNERMHRFLLVYRRVLRNAERVAEYVDARYANGVAVRFIEDTDLSEEAMLVAQRSAPGSSLGQGNN